MAISTKALQSKLLEDADANLSNNPTNDGTANTGALSSSDPDYNPIVAATKTQDNPPDANAPNYLDQLRKLISNPMSNQGLPTSPDSADVSSNVIEADTDKINNDNFFKGMQASNTDATTMGSDSSKADSYYRYAAANGIAIPQTQQANSDQLNSLINSQGLDTPDNTPTPLSSPGAINNNQDNLGIPAKTKYSGYINTDAQDLQATYDRLKKLTNQYYSTDKDFNDGLQSRADAVKYAGIASGIQNMLTGLLMQSRKVGVALPKDIDPQSMQGYQQYLNAVDAKKNLSQQIGDTASLAKVQEQIKEQANLDTPIDDISKAFLKNQIDKLKAVGDDTKNKALDMIDSGNVTLRTLQKNPLMSAVLNNIGGTLIRTETIGDDGKIHYTFTNNKTGEQVDGGIKGMRLGKGTDASGQTYMYDQNQTLNTAAAKNSTLSGNQDILAYIQKNEGFSSKAKQDTNNQWIVGFGTKISADQAAAINAQGGIDRQGAVALQQDAIDKVVKPYMNQINPEIRAKMTPDQVRGYADAFYNLGDNSKNKIIKDLNSGSSFNDSADYIQQFDKAKQPDNTYKQMAGLTARRVDNANLIRSTTGQPAQQPTIIYPLGKAGDKVIDPQTGQPLDKVTNADYSKLNPSQQKALSDAQKDFEKNGFKQYVQSINAGNQVASHLQEFIQQVQSGQRPNSEALLAAQAWVPKMDGLVGHVTDAQYAQFGQRDQTLQNRAKEIYAKYTTGAPLSDLDIGNLIDITKDVQKVATQGLQNTSQIVMGPLQQKIPKADLSLLAPALQTDSQGNIKGNFGTIPLPGYDRQANKLSTTSDTNANNSVGSATNPIKKANHTQLP
jgi:hypothetical protein